MPGSASALAIEVDALPLNFETSLVAVSKVVHVPNKLKLGTIVSTSSTLEAMAWPRFTFPLANAYCTLPYTVVQPIGVSSSQFALDAVLVVVLSALRASCYHLLFLILLFCAGMTRTQQR